MKTHTHILFHDQELCHGYSMTKLRLKDLLLSRYTNSKIKLESDYGAVAIR